MKTYQETCGKKCNFQNCILGLAYLTHKGQIFFDGPLPMWPIGSTQKEIREQLWFQKGNHLPVIKHFAACQFIGALKKKEKKEEKEKDNQYGYCSLIMAIVIGLINPEISFPKYYFTQMVKEK